jgi:hypothetical protein
MTDSEARFREVLEGQFGRAGRKAANIVLGSAGRQWDDWRCYRCGRSHRSSEAPKARVESGAGYLMPVCCD